MESFIGTLIFVLPGFMMYLWIQAFGVGPVVKHTPVEMTAMAALLWLPVSFVSLCLYNLIGVVYHSDPIWNLQGIYENAGRIAFLMSFLVMSAFVSFALSVIYVKGVFPLQRATINFIRKKVGVAGFSEYPSVWDEVFGRHEPQVVRISKLDKGEETGTVGELQKVSRPFEPEKSVCLNDIVYFTNLVAKHPIPVMRVYIDVKSGMRIEIFDYEAVLEAIKQEDSTTPNSE